MKTALLLIAHGSRNQEANDDLVALVEELRKDGSYAIVEAAYLELATPTIDSAAQTCVAGGATRVVLVPYFLSAGVHVRRDLQAHRDQLAVQHGAVEFVVAEPIGRHPMLREIVIQRARESEQSP